MHVRRGLLDRIASGESVKNETFDNKLLAAIRRDKAKLEELLDSVDAHWGEEDAVYRFYHQSYKVYLAQELTRDIVRALHELAPDKPMHPWFLEITKKGTEQRFDMVRSNQNWLEETRPILEALFHAKYMLWQAIRYGTIYESAPQMLRSGWAALLYLYQAR